VAALRPHIQQIADALIADICPQGKADLVGDVAFPLATTVICELLGVPADDRTTFSDWFTAALTPADTPDADVIVDRALKTLNDYIQTLVDAKRGSGEAADGDLLAALIQARDGDDALSEEELVATVFLLLGAGHETTVNLIGNAMLALLTNPDQHRLLRDRPDLLPSAYRCGLRSGMGRRGGQHLGRPPRRRAGWLRCHGPARGRICCTKCWTLHAGHSDHWRRIFASG
jgi:cytochrome P450